MTLLDNLTDHNCSPSSSFAPDEHPQLRTAVLVLRLYYNRSQALSTELQTSAFVLQMYYKKSTFEPRSSTVANTKVVTAPHDHCKGRHIRMEIALKLLFCAPQHPANTVKAVTYNKAPPKPTGSSLTNRFPAETTIVLESRPASTAKVVTFESKSRRKCYFWRCDTCTGHPASTVRVIGFGIATSPIRIETAPKLLWRWRSFVAEVLTFSALAAIAGLSSAVKPFTTLWGKTYARLLTLQISSQHAKATHFLRTCCDTTGDAGCIRNASALNHLDPPIGHLRLR